MSDYLNTQTSFRQPYPGISSGAPIQRSIQPPPLPPRNYAASSVPSYNAYPSSYGSYGNMYGMNSYGGMGGFGGYGSYGGYGSFGGYRPGIGTYGGYGPYGNSITPENRFIQIAEQSARPAFESIQSILGVLGSVTMMFESTFHAIHSSYSSVLSVADNFSKLRGMFGSVLSAFSLIRAFSWLYRKILAMSGFSVPSPEEEDAWASAMGGGEPPQPGATRPSGWPTLMFLAAVLAGPYLIFRLISKMCPPQDTVIWDPRNEPGPMAVALYDFQGQSPQELTLYRSHKYMIAPTRYQTANSGWQMACDKTARIGMVPSNYIVMEAAQPTPSQDPIPPPSTNLGNAATQPQNHTLQTSTLPTPTSVSHPEEVSLPYKPTNVEPTVAETDVSRTEDNSVSQNIVGWSSKNEENADGCQSNATSET